MNVQKKMNYEVAKSETIFNHNHNAYKIQQTGEKKRIMPSRLFNNPSDKYQEIINLKSQISYKSHLYFFEFNLFSFVWWLQLILVISLWFIWWQHVDKSRLLEIVAYGLVVTIIAIIINIIGTEYVLWAYPNKLFPLRSAEGSVNFGVIPFTYMLIYQYYKGWKEYIISIIIMGLLYVFTIEPLGVVLSIRLVL